MTETFHRYPGAQPFRDDEFSRRTFFGRELASVALSDQILANRLVAVYAKSGLGKTSLLNAGVAPRLREAGSLPLFVRVNDIRLGALNSVLEGVCAEAERQQIEYVPGETGSLWGFFKTVEFWQGDLLLTPVLIIDQFEELFTLQSAEAREKFLSEMGHLIRGIAPSSQPQMESSVSNAPPPIHVVLSLREDFLGLLEEASDHIPEILNHRYRLAPLPSEMASKAITEPAAIEHRDIATRPFRLDPALVNSILEYLTKSTVGARGLAGRHVEPFHLQLICQRIEKVAALKQKSSTSEIVITFQDLGGEPALAKTLEDFYTDAIRSLPARHLRGAARMLCEEFLISPEGRRLSVEERELRRQLKLPRETLTHLVERRLLRTDRRSDSTYYELSHDALVQPVLGSRRVQALVVGWTAVLAGSITSLAAAVMLLFTLYFVYTDFAQSKQSDATYGAGIFLVFFSLLIGAFGRVWLRSGIRRRKRYRQHKPEEFAKSLPTLVPLKDRLLGWVMVAIGSLLFTIWGFVGLGGLFVLATVSFTHGIVPDWLSWMEEGARAGWLLMQERAFLEVAWWVAQLSTIVLFGWLLFCRGTRKLWPHKFTGQLKEARVPGVDQPPSLALASLKALFGMLAGFLAVCGLLTLRTCYSTQRGSIPYWLSWSIVSLRLSDACKLIYQNHWDVSGIGFGLFFISLLVFSILLVRTGVAEVLTDLRHRRLAQPEKQNTRAIIAATLGVLVLASLLFCVLYVQHAAHIREQRAGGPISTAVPSAGWAVGDDATILYTENGGTTWKRLVEGKGWLNSSASPTRESSWAVGTGGAIWYSDDGFATHEVQPSGTKENLYWVSAVGPRQAWVVGHNGTILHTEDAGANWKGQYSGVTKGLTCVAFVSPSSGWVVGLDGTILHTENGGNAWAPQESGTFKSLAFVAFPTPLSGWAVGNEGTILHTKDGGATWELQPTRTLRYLDGIAFVSPQSGWVVGDKGTILHTDDAGSTWVRQTSGLRVALTKVFFDTPKSGWAAGGAGLILYTEDGGNTWTPQNTGTRVDLESVSFIKPYGTLGLDVSTPTNDALQRGRTPSSGVAILKIDPDGPAKKAGLKPGDIIVSVNGKSISTTGEFIDEVATLKPGAEATVAFVHNGKAATLNVTIADGSRQKPIISKLQSHDDENTVGTAKNAMSNLSSPITLATKPYGVLGVEFAPTQNPSQPSAQPLIPGVAIVRVSPGGPADKAGLRAGDRIFSVNGKRVDTGQELQKEVSILKPGTEAHVTYIRDGKNITVAVTIGDGSKLNATPAR